MPRILTVLTLHHETNHIHRLIREFDIFSVMNHRFNQPTTVYAYRQRPNLSNIYEMPTLGVRL
ncbi:hypothetical protein [Leuconostoc gelidum]|uniref:Uncharacterized protein n=1 Tax=Leuconostoc gelidum subsp. gelidum TaxID=1607839 RepID=A0ABS7V2F8_LEUGE|nr:hypothetical protein [Leuconostoc gelidum]MBZ5964805.1 hypothetical protein [Leuconostoc gelidum subsp. gelidum]MBZ5977430.1 hypothetical protein [Leuconostoc gelidum subsp. gelidum]MBZ5991847.1 hypothetical protein [Leuconostoc gelidum subsp. gelidum]MBZ5999141.1 hypothetical protein [Leuconostoc gelidum subsp. gelidum]USP17152.1 hypothetical protein J4766_09265 [Leuconostoc gelidum subsp. aenigmaticum]